MPRTFYYDVIKVWATEHITFDRGYHGILNTHRNRCCKNSIHIYVIDDSKTVHGTQRNFIYDWWEADTTWHVPLQLQFGHREDNLGCRGVGWKLYPGLRTSRWTLAKQTTPTPLSSEEKNGGPWEGLPRLPQYPCTSTTCTAYLLTFLSNKLINYSSSFLLPEYSNLSVSGYRFHFRSSPPVIFGFREVHVANRHFRWGLS